MALIKCKECGAEISSAAKACPKCGKGVTSSTKWGVLIGLVFIGIIISSFSSKNSSDTGSQTSSSSKKSLSSSDAEAAHTPEPKIPGFQWSYLQSDDGMSKGAVYQAHVSSSNTVEFDFPYAGAQNATLTLRTHPRHGKDLIFRIERGQILCRSYEDCTVLVRFDDEQAANYTATSAADNSTETIFIRDYSRFAGKMLKAQRVRIAANIYQEGAPVFEFDVSGFDQNKYKPINRHASKPAYAVVSLDGSFQ